MIKGITVTLINKKQVDTDPFDAPIYEDMPINVDNVLVSPTSTEDIINQLELTGKRRFIHWPYQKATRINGKTKKLSFRRKMACIWKGNARN